MSEQPEFDVVIVGGGVVGSVLARHLTRAHKKVVLLEAGVDDALSYTGYESFVQRLYEYPNRPNTPYRQNDNAGMPGIPWPAKAEDDPAAWASDKQYWIQKGPVKFGSDYARALGGTTLHWLGISMRHVPNDFKIRERYGCGRDWPVSYDTLEPYYRRAEYELGVAADVEEQSYLGIHFARGYRYPMVSFPMTYFNHQLQKDIQGMRFTMGDRDYPVQVVPIPRAANADPTPGAGVKSNTWHGDPADWEDWAEQQALESGQEKPEDTPYRPQGNPTPLGAGLGERCEGNSSCIPVCPVQAKYNATKSLAMAVPEHLALRYQCVASKVLFDRDNHRITGIEYKEYTDPEKKHHHTHVVRGKIYVLAAHAAENAKLCLISGVANKSGQMGRNLMDHPYLNFSGLYPRKIWGYRGPDVTGGMPLLRDGSFRLEHAAFRTDLGNWGWEFPKGAPATVIQNMVETQGLRGKALRQALEEQGPRHMRIGFLMEQLPDSANRVTVKPGKHLDKLGIERPVIHYNVDEYTLRGMEQATRFTEAIFARAGIEMQPQGTFSSGVAEYNNKTYHFWGSGHLIGTHVMGDHERDSVVDSWQQSWDHDNLFLAGCGSHPTSATANPTLTMTAMAFRTLDKILEKLND